MILLLDSKVNSIVRYARYTKTELSGPASNLLKFLNKNACKFELDMILILKRKQPCSIS